MKDLNIRGCTQLAVHPFDFSLVQNTFEWVNVEAGWGLSDSTFSSFGFSSWKLRSLAVGVGGSISGHTLLCISEKCPELKRLSLCFQVGPRFIFSCMEYDDCMRSISNCLYTKVLTVPLYCIREVLILELESTCTADDEHSFCSVFI